MVHPYTPDLPQQRLPIMVVGAGGIMNDAHLPAYSLFGFPVAGIYDIEKEKARATAEKFSIPKVYNSLEEMLALSPPDRVFDLALPASQIIGVLEQLPRRSNVLIQKPMGENLHQARQILKLTREKQMIAGVNFQLRYAPSVRAARELLFMNTIGALCDIEVYVNVYTPWDRWNFLFNAPRVEILYHSIHYIDLVRSFCGNPESVYARTFRHLSMPELHSVRSTIIMDYGDWLRTQIITNHCNPAGLEHQQSYIRFEGTNGSIKLTLGSLLNYPHGVPDHFEYIITTRGREPEYKTLDIAGSWFPHAFAGSMAQVMRAAEGAIPNPDNSVEDCIHTMACVEAAYESNKKGGIRPEL